MTDTQPVLVFDGVCVLCSRILRWVLWADQKKQLIQYATAQSETGQSALKKHGYDPEIFETVMLIMPDGTLHVKLDVAIEVAKILGGAWHTVRILKILPKGWRDAIYDFVATRRYQWFGKSDYCALLPEKYSDRIIK